jgi:3-(3-hydroxy-phenyl)propionate hydroxylase
MSIELLGKDPVIIAGAGPVGCTLALYLARNDIPVLLLEAEAELPEDLRASTWHPPTLDMLDELEITEDLIATGLIVPNYQYRDRRTGEYADFDMSALGDATRHHYRLQTEQFRLTRIVVPILEKMPHAEVRFEHKVANVTQTDEAVFVDVETPNGVETLRGSVVFGGDGANSAVRRKASIEFEGFTYPEKFLVASTPYPLQDHFPGLAWVNYVADPDEWCVLLRCNNLWRCLFPTAPGDTNEKLLSDDYIQERLHFLADIDGDFEIGHRTLYNVHQRVAKQYRIGRILLGGDSAHVNNPLGGMGMNGGIHDAINLGEKLVMISKGEANDDILDLYDRQRRIICKRFVQAQTIANKKALEEKDPEAQRKAQEKYMKTAADPALAKEFLMRTSMIDSVRESYEIN